MIYMPTYLTYHFYLLSGFQTVESSARCKKVNEFNLLSQKLSKLRRLCQEIRDITGYQSELQCIGPKRLEWISKKATDMWLLTKGIEEHLEAALTVNLFNLILKSQSFHLWIQLFYLKKCFFQDMPPEHFDRILKEINDIRCLNKKISNKVPEVKMKGLPYEWLFNEGISDLLEELEMKFTDLAKQRREELEKSCR